MGVTAAGVVSGVVGGPCPHAPYGFRWVAARRGGKRMGQGERLA